MSSLVGQGSKRHVVGRYEKIIDDSCLSSAGDKCSRNVSNLKVVPLLPLLMDKLVAAEGTS